MKLMDPGTLVDGFVIGQCLHAGGMAHIYSVTFQNNAAAPFPMVMKVPRMTAKSSTSSCNTCKVRTCHALSLPAT